MSDFMKHIAKLNELMTAYSSLLSKREGRITQYKDETNEEILKALEVLDQHDLKLLRSKHMDVQEEFFRYLSQFDSK